MSKTKVERCSLEAIYDELNRLKNPEKAKILQRFFKTAPGEYAEGDIFLGIKVPEVRACLKLFETCSLEIVSELLRSKYHEARLLALLLLVKKFAKASENEKETIYRLYLENTRFINNWDLVDLSAEQIVGAFLFHQEKDTLFRLAESENLWERRIAMLASFHYIKKNHFGEALLLAKRLLHDEHDLIHKAVGWMLREIGKRNQEAEEGFLKEHYHTMPRTMLRYAIEKFPEPLRQAYLKGHV
ncbi:DNA alkylation repair enzyme [Chloroherpeton thalassium ATCC 35110]|uniref:DNA alkylation repair enzyme n=1 Tax=Chloroherpeton thalassium (strain ATCC 35110 / GB-78) TaxID=517418 RepID=B3QS20_CHLT3|nr:DNA alkylation repair protein [Chloroherpeton thalassium]ACF13965.1 DNA alkylation repair enzyme [Chloroherpeton thalassium ATCC 35110]